MKYNPLTTLTGSRQGNYLDKDVKKIHDNISRGGRNAPEHKLPRHRCRQLPFVEIHPT
jgi:hypothetical protein